MEVASERMVNTDTGTIGTDPDITRGILLDCFNLITDQRIHIPRPVKEIIKSFRRGIKNRHPHTQSSNPDLAIGGDFQVAQPLGTDGPLDGRVREKYIDAFAGGIKAIESPQTARVNIIGGIHFNGRDSIRGKRHLTGTSEPRKLFG